MKIIRLSAICVFLFAGEVMSANLTIPNTFSPNTPAKAAEVNQNFDAVKTTVNQHETSVNSLTGRVNALETVKTQTRSFSVPGISWGIAETNSVPTYSKYGLRFPYWTDLQRRSAASGTDFSAVYSMKHPSDHVSGDVTLRFVFLGKNTTTASMSYGFRLEAKSYTAGMKLNKTGNIHSGTGSVGASCTTSDIGCLAEITISVPASELTGDVWVFELERSTSGDDLDDLYLMYMSVEYSALL